VIPGLIAAFGWGLADFFGAVAGRKLGSLWTVMIAQGFVALGASVVLLVSGHGVSGLAAAAALLTVNGLFSATAYVTHYRALELGPVAVVSPVGATYALVGSVLAIVVLGERPNLLVIIGGIVTVLGVMLTSTDVAKLRAGTHGMPPGLPWAIVSSICFGVGGFTLASLSRDLGWEVGLWSSRVVQLGFFVVVGLVRRRELQGRAPRGSGVVFAVVVGATDLLGVLAYTIGALGFVTVVFVASAVFPLIAVGLSVAFLGERPVPNQYAGVMLTVLGLVSLGIGSS
jgi:drug/metabolite transporter (DMT)-like permease